MVQVTTLFIIFINQQEQAVGVVVVALEDQDLKDSVLYRVVVVVTIKEKEKEKEKEIKVLYYCILLLVF
jgi:hypothetical protein